MLVYTLAFHVSYTSHFLRVLLASIRNLGQCPCPRCTIPMTRVHNLGMVRDIKERGNLVRNDDRVRQNKIQNAHSHIYEAGLGVTSVAVEDLLKDQSLVPSSVRLQICSPPSYH